MKTQAHPSSKKTEPANPLLNAAIIAAVALAILPAAIFGAARCYQSRVDSSTKDVEVEAPAPKRTSVAERRAQRLEARKAKEAKAKNTYPEISMETVEPYYDGFWMDDEAGMEFNGFGMMPPPPMAGGMMPAPYMGGPGMMPVPNRGDFNEFRRMPGAEMGFSNKFGRGRGDF
jgi:hypothetical protein